ncbi:hypothetical protein, partial [Bacillus cereus]|uniref:hypothetical protein n=1 Tax=Bacillus cereus TaxID=1396 RepID=UPI003D6575BE
DAILETARKNFIFWSGLFQYALKTVPRKNQSGFTLDLLPLDLLRLSKHIILENSVKLKCFYIFIYKKEGQA